MSRPPWGLGRAEPWFFLLLWLASLAIFRTRGLLDPGSLWHTVVGDRILADGFMRTDPFTYTHVGMLWIPQQWGAEIAMSLLHRLGGLDGLLLGLATLLATTGTFLFARLRRDGMGTPLAAVAVCGGGVAISYHVVVRPHMATIALLAVVAAWLVDFDRGRVGRGRLLWLIPLCVVWTNLHGGVLAGIASYGFAVALWFTGNLPVGRRLIDAPELSRRDAELLAGLGFLLVLTPLVNPFGLEMVRTWGRLVNSPALQKYVTEHQPTQYDSTIGLVLLAAFAAYLFLLAGTLPNRPRATWLLPLVWFALTAKSVRNGPLFVAVTLPVAADIWAYTRWYRYFRRSGDTLAVELTWGEPRERTWIVPVLAVLLAAGLQATSVEASLVGRGWAYLYPEEVPVELASPLRERVAALGPGVRIINDANLGGFLIYHVPGVPIFMDDRFELYGDEWTADYGHSVRKNPSRMLRWADEYGARLALVARGETAAPLAAAFEGAPGWKKVAECASGALFERVGP